MRIFFMTIFTMTVLFSSVPNTTKELDMFQEKITLQNAQNMFEAALDFYYENKTDEMMDTYHELIDKFGNSTNKETLAIIAQAMFNLALGYEYIGDIEAEKKLYEQIISKFINLDDEDIEFIVANSLYAQGLIADDSNDTKNEIEIYKKFLNRFKNTNNEDIYMLTASIMLNLGYVYGKTGSENEAIDIYNKLVRQFENYENEYVQSLVAQTLMNMGVNYADLGKTELVLSSYQKLINKFKNSANPNIIKTVGMTITNKIEVEICNNIKPSFNYENEKLANLSEYSTFMYEFLQILYAATYKQQTDKLKLWKDKYSNLNLAKLDINFDFSDLDTWLEKLKNPKKIWVKECVDVLKEFVNGQNLSL